MDMSSVETVILPPSRMTFIAPQTVSDRLQTRSYSATLEDPQMERRKRTRSQIEQDAYEVGASRGA